MERHQAIGSDCPAAHFAKMLLSGLLIPGLWRDYAQSTGKQPYDFQQEIVITIAKVCSADGHRFFGEFPTGCGKSVMISLLAQLLHVAFMMDVYIVAPDAVLTTIGFDKYALKNRGIDALKDSATLGITKIRHTTLKQFEALSVDILR